MNWNTIIGVAASISFLLPVVTIFYYKLYQHRSLAILLFYYLLTALSNLMSQNILPASASFKKGYSVLDNYLDIPLMLMALLFFCPVKQKGKSVHIITAIFIGYEIIIASMYGLNPKAIVYIMGPGLPMVLGYSFYLFSKQIKITVEYGKNAGKTLMLAAILFAYGCYAFIYYFYYIQKTPYVKDIFFLYFIASLISSIIMTVGLHLIRKRMKELQEVKNTRRELAMFFGN